MVVEQRPEGGPITLMTAGASNLPTDPGRAVELAVEVVKGFDALRTKVGSVDALLDIERDESVESSGVAANKPVVLSQLHYEHPPRWVTLTGRGLASVTGFESEAYMADSANQEFWAVASIVDRVRSCRISCVGAVSAKRRDSTTALAPTRSRTTEPLWLRRGADDARHEREHGERRELELSVYAPLFDLPKRAGAVRRAARQSGRIAQRALLGAGHSR